MTVSSATLMPGAAPRHCTTMQRCPLNDGMFATGGTDEVVCLWDDRTLRPMVVGSGHSAPVSSVTWACDGRQVLSGAVDSAVMLWNVYGQE
jgi:WD40 repeat protein